MLALAFLTILVFVSGCASSAPMTPDYRAQLIYQLKEALAEDRRNAFDPGVSPVTVGDFMLQADKARQVIDTLEEGGHPSDAALRDALFVPPKSLSTDQRGQLIAEIKGARRLDRRGQKDWTRDPINQQDFRVQEIKATRAIRKLEFDQPISWAEIEQAKEVPWDP
ncbi:MAG TPA: hypothetical protein VEJ86_08335 [Candidatus Binataceae bacterium]|nr:hypothetical protein [Candidatus Binataceae bacterium]